MMSARRFSRDFPGVWSAIAPGLISATRKINTFGINVQHFGSYIPESPMPSYSAELAFRMLEQCRKLEVSQLSMRDVYSLERATAKYIQRLSGAKVNLAKTNWRSMSRQAAYAELGVLQDFLKIRKSSAEVTLRPRFDGCSIIEQCFGDILIDDELVEIKSSMHGFESRDLRQVLVYCMLAYAAKNPQINRITLVNPIMNIYATVSVESVIEEISGHSAIVFFENMILALESFYTSSGSLSNFSL